MPYMVVSEDEGGVFWDDPEVFDSEDNAVAYVRSKPKPPDQYSWSLYSLRYVKDVSP